MRQIVQVRLIEALAAMAFAALATWAIRNQSVQTYGAVKGLEVVLVIAAIVCLPGTSGPGRALLGVFVGVVLAIEILVDLKHLPLQELNGWFDSLAVAGPMDRFELDYTKDILVPLLAVAVGAVAGVAAWSICTAQDDREPPSP
jgi:uncharacterized membrane protein